MAVETFESAKIQDDMIDSMAPYLGAYHVLRRHVIRSKRVLKTSNDAEEFKQAWNNMNLWVQASLGYAELKNVRAILEDLSGTIKAANQSNSGHSEVVNILEVLYRRINDIIYEENRKSKIELLRAICLFCAEHAEEIAEFVDLDEIFCD